MAALPSRPSNKVGQVQREAERPVQYTFMMNQKNMTMRPQMFHFTIIKSYSTGRVVNDPLANIVSELYGVIEKPFVQHPHPGLILASHSFREPFPAISEKTLLSLSTMDLLIRYAYPSVGGYAKFTILLTMKRTHGANVTFTIGNAIPLTLDDGVFIPKSEILGHIIGQIRKYSELYDGEAVSKVTLRVYTVGKKTDIDAMCVDDVKRELEEFKPYLDSPPSLKNLTAKQIKNKNKKYPPNHITSLKSYATHLQPFLVADTETLFRDDIHVPYAAGLLMVHPDDELNEKTKERVSCYYSEDYSSYLYDSFEKKSTQLLKDFIQRIRLMIKLNPSIKTVYMHNFGRFDGVLIIRHLSLHHPNYQLKPLMRNNMLYELAIYEGNTKVFSFRDSLHLLPGSLDNLAKSLCRELGVKGSIDYDSVTVENLGVNKIQYLDYMKQDILLLGGVMQKAQSLYFSHYNLDIVSKITCSSLALTIFRMKYYDAEKNPIGIPNQNADRFLRRGYYGGHTDLYKRYGQKLYYYDVNSLYPFIMKEYSIPGGQPVWHGNLCKRNIDELFGFIEALVICPEHINRPFLPYRGKDGILIFPTGKFIGVYYSEELKYAQKLGYKVFPISGYLFQERESPFKQYVSSLYASRLQAKKEGNDGMSFVYKILMNSLYGRFGINPKSTKTEICDSTRYNVLLRQKSFIDSHMLRENQYVVSYHTNMDDESTLWEPPQNTVVHISAAITANARIYMYPYISRDDCYYTDTDSIFLGNPLNEDEISTEVLGKFKLEETIVEGVFLAAKCYLYATRDGNNVIKFKGPAKDYVDPKWFWEQYADVSRWMVVPVTSKFRVCWQKFTVGKKETDFRLGIPKT